MVAVCGLIVLFGPTVWIAARFQARIVELPVELPDGRAAGPKVDVALVLGAGLRADGSPSPVLAARVMAGVQLYQPWDGSQTCDVG